MNNPGSRFYKQTTVRFLASVCTIGFSSLAIGQQNVAPRANGYGNQAAPPAAQQPTGRPNNTQQIPNTPGAKPNPGFAPQGANMAPVNPAMNPALNPALNQRPVANQQQPQNNGNGSGKEVVTADPYAANPPTTAQNAFCDSILKDWENATANIDRYSCKFLRWQYNSSENFVDELAKKTGKDIREINTSSASGELKYMAPDKGMFRIDMLVKLTGQLDAKNQLEYKSFDNVFGEWWLCDGEKVYEYDRSGKRCTKFTMPSEMKGAGILESPMPFMFGVKAEKIKERYWVRALPPPNDQQGKPRNDIHVIEAYPKYQSDATNYDHVQVYIDREIFLPIMLIKFNTDHIDQPNSILKDNREIFQFSDRIKNATLLQKISDVVWRREFIPVEVPKDWTVEERSFAPPATENIRSASNMPQVPNSTPNGTPNSAPNSVPNIRK